MFLALTEALQARDAFSGAHSLRVATLAGTVGERLGWDEARLTRLRVGAPPLRGGQTAVPPKSPAKPRPLTEMRHAPTPHPPVAGGPLTAAARPGHGAPAT